MPSFPDSASASNAGAESGPARTPRIPRERLFRDVSGMRVSPPGLRAGPSGFAARHVSDPITNFPNSSRDCMAFVAVGRGFRSLNPREVCAAPQSGAPARSVFCVQEA